jgi:signal transduction histidine kinase
MQMRSFAIKNSIGFQLNALFVLLATVLLSASGALFYWHTKHGLEQQYAAERAALQRRLQANLQQPIWNMDLPLLHQIVATELKPPILGIEVTSDNGKRLEQQGQLPNARGNTDTLRFPVMVSHFGHNYVMGHIRVVLTREDIQRELATQAWARMLEIVALDAMLVLTLSLSLRTLMLQPLNTLRKALAEAAEHRSMKEGLIRLNERHDEFGDVVRSFNRIAHRLEQDIEKGRQDEARIRQAYEELKQTQDTLMQAEKLAALGGLVAGVAHELNTPIGNALTAVSGLERRTQMLGEALQAAVLTRDEMDDYLRYSKEAAGLSVFNLSRAAELVHSFKQIAVDQSKTDIRQFDLGEYLQEILRSLSPTLKKTGCTVELDCPRDILMSTYAGPLSQVISNLVMNAALHAYPPDAPGPIRIVAQAAADNRVAITVSDEGVGIPPEHQRRVFEPFFTTRRGQGGCGLGLHIVHNLVTQTLAGSIQLEAKRLRGTVFAVTIPRAQSEQARTPSAQADPHPAQGSQS